ncbi:methyl-accepting chemotaxis protein [Methyloversatilis thermotolerans]|uniref:methyl-accepting chemotaxis protein n=1 Tax=Methyloversatilis thermotolerans TaxID=1346290 RepID=UPI00038279CB|nr:methyl-accepting chemotaxis protein [Methyloversatilis thermotolerans]
MKNMLSIRKAFLFHSILASVVCTAVFTTQELFFPGVAGVIVAAVICTALIMGVGIWFGTGFGQRAELLVNAMHALAEGKLNHKLSLSGKDDFAWLGYEYNQACKSFRKLIEKMTVLSSTLTSSAEELSRLTVHANQTGGQQADRIRTVAEAMEQMTASARQVADLSADMDRIVREAGDSTRSGKSDLEVSMEGVSRIAREMEESLQVIERLVKDSEEIAKINDVVKDISDQTNLLALNAAIEAARAGEQGRGFAVVADEVRKLAQRTQGSTADIEQIVAKIRHDAQETVERVGQASQRVSGAVTTSRGAVETFENILGRMEELVNKSGEVATSMREQDTTANSILRNAGELSALSEDNARGVALTATQGESVASSARELEGSLRTFQI